MRGQSRSRCDFLLSWVFLASLTLLLVNDFYLKPYRPGVLSGLLSDAAGMVFFPILLVALAEVAMLLAPSRRLASPSWFALASLAVAVAFVGVKFSAWGEQAYSWAVGPLSAVPGSVFGLGTTGVVADPLDLLALLLAPLAYWVGRAWRSKPEAAHP